MARLREFDIDDALDAAMQTFWLQGYEATSLVDLMAATGLQKGSIYKAFKDKHSLFISALHRYFEAANDFHRQFLEQPESPKAGLTQWLRQLVATYGNYDDGRGCFVVNSLVEMAPHDAEVKQLVANQIEYLRTLICRAIVSGQALGEFRDDIDAEDLSLLLLNLVHGIIVSAKGAIPKQKLQRQAELAIALLA